MTSEHVMQQAQEQAITIEAESLQMNRANAVVLNAASSSPRAAANAEERRVPEQATISPARS